MEQMNIFIIVMLIHLVLCFEQKNVYAILISFISVLIENFITIYEDATISAFTLLVVLICALVTAETVFPEKMQRKRRK